MLLEELSETSPFYLLSDESLVELQKSVSVRKIAKGENLCYEKECVNYVYFVLEGAIKVYKVDRYNKEVLIYYVYPSQFLGELNALTDGKRFANAEVVESGRVLTMPVKIFRELLNRNLGFSFQMYTELAKKANRLQELINREIVFDGMAKVAFLLDTEPEVFITHKKSDIAQMLNLQPETLSRLLKKLARKNIIRTEHNRVEILDRKALRAVYEEEE